MNHVKITPSSHWNLGIVGFGEVAQTFVKGWRGDFLANIVAYDRKTDRDGHEKDIKLGEYEENDIITCLALKEVVSCSDYIFSLVTADQAEKVANEVSSYIKPNTFYFDCNSCSPETKRRSSDAISLAGGRYIDVAIMAPVAPLKHKTPLYLSGEFAEDAASILNKFDMSGQTVSLEVGHAASIKLVRSIMIKGLEALSAEFIYTAKKLGVEDIVVQTLDETFPDFDWKNNIKKMIQRMETHGLRRAEEMHEVSSMLKSVGISNHMSVGAANWHMEIGKRNISIK